MICVWISRAGVWIGMGIGLWYGFGSVVPLAISAQRIPLIFLFPDCGFENYGRFGEVFTSDRILQSPLSEVQLCLIDISIRYIHLTIHFDKKTLTFQR